MTVPELKRLAAEVRNGRQPFAKLQQILATIDALPDVDAKWLGDKLLEEQAEHTATMTKLEEARAELAFVRQRLWLEHGHSGPALYGDDGEMQCKDCREMDYRRAPLVDLVHQAFEAVREVEAKREKEKARARLEEYKREVERRDELLSGADADLKNARAALARSESINVFFLGLISDRIQKHSRRLENGCVEWTGARRRHGYATVSVAGTMMVVSRLIWSLHNGPIPKGLVVMHSCDYPPCINIDHLSIGTHSDNMRDMVAKGRRPSRGGHTSGKLNEADVLEIRRRFAAGEPLKDISKSFDVHRAHLNRIIRRENWAHV